VVGMGFGEGELEFWTGCFGRIEDGGGSGWRDEEFAPFVVKGWCWCWGVGCDGWRN